MNKKLVTYFILSFTFSWVISLYLAFSYTNNINANYQLHYLTSFGPLISAIITTLIFNKVSGLKDYLKKSFSFNPNQKFLLTVLSPLFFL